MNHNKTIHLKGPAQIAKAMEIKRTFDKAQAEQQELQAEYQRKVDAHAEESRLAVIARWTELFTMLGMDPSELKKWSLHAQFLEAHGAAFLVYLGDGEVCPGCGERHEPEGGEDPIQKLLGLVNVGTKH